MDPRRRRRLQAAGQARPRERWPTSAGAASKLADAYGERARLGAAARDRACRCGALARVRSLMADSGRPRRAPRCVPRMLQARRCSRVAMPAAQPLRSNRSPPMAKPPGAADERRHRARLAPAEPGRCATSAEELQTRRRARSGTPPPGPRSAATVGQLNQPLRHRCVPGESVFVLGDLRGAIDRLRASQRAARGAATAEFHRGLGDRRPPARHPGPAARALMARRQRGSSS